MNDRPLTRADVEAAYRFLLGRPPENEAAYEYGLSAGDAGTLRRWLMNGREFTLRLRQDPPFALRRWMLEEMQAAPAEEDAKGPPRIVFLHLMKTAGSSIRRRLEQIAGDAPIWRHEVEGRPGDAAREVLARYRVVMGHFTMADARHVPGPRRIFTVLRDPRERLISQYYFLHRHREAVLDRPGMSPSARIARGCTLEQFLRHPSPEIQNDLRNVMTRTLAGDYLLSGRNRYRQPWDLDEQAITGPELLSRALTNLFSLDFYSFTDRLEQDRPRLMRILGVPDTGPFPQENTQELVSDMLEKRPPPKVTPAAEKLLHRLTDLDRVLYRLARQAVGVR